MSNYRPTILESKIYTCGVCGRDYKDKDKAELCSMNHMEPSSYTAIYKDGEAYPYAIDVKFEASTFEIVRRFKYRTAEDEKRDAITQAELCGRFEAAMEADLRRRGIK